MVSSLLGQLVLGKSLSSLEAEELFRRVMAGELTAGQIAGVLVAMRAKGEIVDELLGAARAMRVASKPVPWPDASDSIDTCGTGGDGKGTVNISTMASVLCAAMGMKVVKHGNRSVSSKSGSADVLETLGLRIDPAMTVLEQTFRDVGIAFLFAPSFHPAMKHAASVRRELGIRTVFNLLGPVTNPAKANYQVLGVFDKKWCEPLAKVLLGVGSKRAMVISADEGMDEFSVAGITHVAEVKDGAIGRYTVTPEDFGLSPSHIGDLKGGDAEFNANVFRQLASGSANRSVTNAVSMAAGAAAVVYGIADDLSTGCRMAEAAVADGKMAEVLSRWVKVSSG